LWSVLHDLGDGLGVGIMLGSFLRVEVHNEVGNMWLIRCGEVHSRCSRMLDNERGDS